MGMINRNFSLIPYNPFLPANMLAEKEKKIYLQANLLSTDVHRIVYGCERQREPINDHQTGIGKEFDIRTGIHRT